MPDPVTGVMAGTAILGQQASSRAASKQAAAQEAAGRMGADASVLRPVGIKTGLGGTTFGYETLPSGVERLSSAEFQLDPRLRALQEMQYGIPADVLSKGYDVVGTQFAPTQEYAQQLRNLATGILPSADVNARAADIYSQQMAMMDPQRQREEQRLAAGVFGRGRAGLSVGSMGQPELFALGQSRAEQDRAAAIQAQQQARGERLQDIQLSSGLFGAAGQTAMTPFQQLTQVYQPYNTALAGITGIEDIGKGLFDISTGLGGGSSAAGSALSSGFANAANIRSQAAQDRIGMLQNLATGIANKYQNTPTAGETYWNNYQGYEAYPGWSNATPEQMVI